MKTKENKTACKKKVKMTEKNSKHGRNSVKATVRASTCKKSSDLPMRRGSSITSLSLPSQSSCRPRIPFWLDKYNAGKSTFHKPQNI